jgi:hypothetical protein
VKRRHGKRREDRAWQPKNHGRKIHSKPAKDYWLTPHEGKSAAKRRDRTFATCAPRPLRREGQYHDDRGGESRNVQGIRLG